MSHGGSLAAASPAMDAAASAPQGYGALVRQLSRQLSRQSSLDDAAFNLVDLPGELLALILYRLLLAHDIAQLAPLCSALRDAAQLVFQARPYSREVRTLSRHTDYVVRGGGGRRRPPATDRTVSVPRRQARAPLRPRGSAGRWWRVLPAARASSAARAPTPWL